MSEKPPYPPGTDAAPPAYSPGPSQPAPYPAGGQPGYPPQPPYQGGPPPAGYPGGPPGGYPGGPPAGYPGGPPAGYPGGPPAVGPDGKPYVQPVGQPMMHQPVGVGVAPGGYVAGQPVAATNTVVVVQQHMFRQSPVNTVCPHCHQNIITSTNAEAGGLTWLLCAGICLFGFWLGCCLIPFCIDDCQDIRHSCPNCKNTIHVFRRL